MNKKPTGVPDGCSHAMDIGLAMQMIEGFEPAKLPPWEMVGKEADGTPIYRNNWGAYSQWVQVSERMPPLGERVLCYSLKRGFDVARVEKYWDGWVTDDGKNLVRIAYTHWMPMPQPPEVSDG